MKIVKMQRCISLCVIFCTVVIAFPAENGSTVKPVRTTAATTTTTTTTTKAPIKKVPVVQNTTQSSSNEPPSTKPITEEKKQTLTYVLGQPKKPGMVSSPAQFLSPDRYEFYTFDDDGQIIKKLMSVKEIQKIIANTDKGSAGEASNPIEYYQVLSVSPDVESLPAVSRINPNEPLFSIHDVIASVQNVLKAEIQTKQSQKNATTTQKPTTVEIPKNVTSHVTTTAKPIKATTYRPKTQPTKTKTSKPAATTPVNKAGTTTEAPKTTKKPVTTTKKPTTTTRKPTTTTTTTTTTTPKPLPLSQPLSLADAHPAYTSNESFADMAPISSIVLPMEIPELRNQNVTIPESALQQVQIPINQDLAESVSSVLSQIASEISLNQFENAERNYTEEATTTEFVTEATTLKPSTLPLSWLKTTEPPVETSSKSFIVPQNRPRPFQKPQDTEKLVTSETGGAGSAVNEERTTTTTEETQTELPEDSNELALESKLGDELIINSSTEEAPIVTTISYESVTQSAEHVKLTSPKIPIEVSKNETKEETISGVQVVEEGNTGRIPRPTEKPDIERIEFTTQTEIPETTTIVEESSTEGEFDETTTTEPEDNSSSVEELGISFVPMVIKSEDSSTEETDAEEQTEKIEELESKIIPDSEKSPIIANDTSATEPESSLKQNKPFGKPPKPVFVKPNKAKPQDAKPAKPKPTKEPEKRPYENHLQTAPSALELEAAPDENLGLEATTAGLDPDVRKFADLCNELAFSLWSSVTHNGLSFVRSLVVSPFAVTSLLAMVFLGARGPTSGQMNDVLKLDDMVTFNPHLVFRNVTESLVISRNPGVATAAFVRELYSDKSKGKLLDFYKERAQQFYDGHVEEINFKTIGETLRRQTNHLVKRQTWGKITDFLRGSSLALRPPLAAFSANIFQTDCSKASTKDRDGEMYFVILPASRLRRLVPIPAVVWRDGFLAGYEPNLDATAVSLSPVDSVVSTIFVLPGQQGLIAPGDSLARLEHHLLGASYKRGHWARLMKSLLPRPGLELQIPRLSHRSVINVTTSLQKMGLRDLFSAEKADLTGLNGLQNDLHLSDMLQMNLFSTCGEEPIGARHHAEIYPASPLVRREKSSDSIFAESIERLFAISDFEDPSISALPLELRPRQPRIPLARPGARIPEPPRLRFDRPFLFFVRHNPTGLILHMGRFNPRLTP